LPQDKQARIDRTAADIVRICEEVKTLLLEKNQAYGDAALTPDPEPGSLSPAQAIAVRIKDKTKRLQMGSSMTDESRHDTRIDRLGYRILELIAEEREEEGSL
jgi:hypothetical protein